MPKRLILTIVCFCIAAALLVYEGTVALTAALGNWAPGEGTPFIGGLLTLRIMFALYAALYWLCAVGIALVIRGLSRLAYWAWIAGLVICGMMIASFDRTLLVSLVLGGLSLGGLVDPESVRAFRPGWAPDEREAPADAEAEG